MKPAGYRIMGSILLVAGTALLLLAALEIRTFPLFAEGGRFHYEGFGPGSFMFGNIASQVVVYALVGTALAALGYGHIRLLSWARTLAAALSYLWLVVGLPVMAVLLFILAASKELPASLYYAAIALSACSCILVPVAVIRHYSRAGTAAVFTTASGHQGRIGSLPARLVASALAFLFLMAVSLLLLFFNGVFPIFGAIASGIGGKALIGAHCLLLAALAIGTLRRQLWSWWAAVAYYPLMAASLTLTFARHGYRAILDALAFPEAEMQWLGGIPLQGWHVLVATLPPLALALINTIVCAQHYRRRTLPGQG